MSLNKLETTLDKVLNKKAPFKIPQGGRKALAGALWWIALVIGILNLLGAFGIWQAGHRADEIVDYANSLSSYYGGSAVAVDLGIFYYLSLLTMAAVGVLLLIASPKLKAMQKGGWNLLYYILLLQVLVAVLQLFDGAYGGFSDFLWSLIGAVIGGYLLFQVRDNFKGASPRAASK